MLPSLVPAVTIARRVPFALCPTPHRTDVSATQSVRSHPDPPLLTAIVYAATPSFAPCTVRLVEPVAPIFTPPVLLSDGRSIDTAWVAVATYAPALIDTCRHDPSPDTVRQRVDVSDSHKDACADVWLKDKERAVYFDDPKLIPAIVALTAPVPAVLERTTALAQAPSTDRACVKLPTRLPAVIAARRVDAMLSD